MFTIWDWAVLVAYIAGTTWLAGRLAGKQQTIRDFFLGGRQLPWPAVCGSMVAGVVSGVTFVAVPAAAWAKGGNYTYLMLAVGAIAARVIIGTVFVPAFYRREIYSPYEFMGQRLGPVVDRAATALFFLGGFLAQGARLFLAALVLDAITHMGIAWAVIAIGGISVVWTWIGGITSVIWTDVIQFVVLFLGAIVALVAVVLSVPGGVPRIVEIGQEAGKFTLWNFTIDRTSPFTFWCGLFGATFLNVGAMGTDQGLAQRLFCCRDERHARKAILASSVGELLVVIMLTVGVGVFAYFQTNPMTPEETAMVAKRRDYVFPFFILHAMPVGVKGLLFAAIFSAATATSTLSAMAQVGLTSFYLPFCREKPPERRLVFLSRVFVLLAAIGLCGTAIACTAIDQYPGILDLALSMAAYTYGALLGMFLLALLPLRRDARGLIWGIPLSVLLVFALSWNHTSWGPPVAGAGAGVCAVVGLARLWREPGKLALVLIAAAAVMAVAMGKPLTTDGKPAPFKLAFPWHYPLGTIVTLGLGYAVGRPTALPERPSTATAL